MWRVKVKSIREQILTITTGFTILYSMEKRAHIPLVEQGINNSPVETSNTLTDRQRNVAEIAFFKVFLEHSNANAKGQLPWLRTKETGTDKEIRTRHITGLLDAYISLPQGQEGKRKLEANWGEKSDYLVGQVSSIIPDLAEEREKIFSEAKDWSSRDEKREIRKTYATLSKLPREQQELLYDRTSLEPEKMRTKATRWGVTVGANVGSMYALDGVASVVGIGGAWTAEKINHMVTENPHALDTVPKSVLLPVLGASYYAWWRGVRPNLEQNWHLLEETGVSTNALSKFMYDRAEKMKSSEKKQKLASKVGYVGLELVKEWPYYTAALGAAAVSKDISTQESLIFLASANIGAAGYEAGLGQVTKKFLRVKDGFNRKKSSDNK